MPLTPLDPAEYRDIVRRALEEDVRGGDVTTDATVPATLRARGVFLVNADCVLAGGATNHRVGLFDAVLIKDNHVRLAGGVAAAVASARARNPDTPVEVEAQTLAEVDQALDAGAEVILVDNMDLGAMREAVRRAKGR